MRGVVVGEGGRSSGVLLYRQLLKLEVLRTTEPLRRTYESSDYRTFGIESSHRWDSQIKHQLTDAL